MQTKTILIIDKGFKAIELQDRLNARPSTRIIIENSSDKAMMQIKAGPHVIFLNPKQLSIQQQVILENWRTNSAWLAAIPFYLLLDANATATDQLLEAADETYRKPISWGQLLDIAFQAIDEPLRRNIRHDVDFTIEGHSADDQLFKGLALNISKSGILIEADSKLAVDQQVTLNFLVHDRSQVFELEVCEVQALVRRAEPRGTTAYYGLEFVEQDPEQIEQIDTLLSTILA